MISNVSFGQTTKITQQEQGNAPQGYYYVAPQEQTDSYVSSKKKKKSSPIKKFLATAVVVLGGSALATKIPAVKKAVEKIANGTEKANIVDKALNGVNKLGEKVIEVATKGKEKVKGLFSKTNAETTESAEKVAKEAEKAVQEVKLSSEDLITFSSKNKVSKEMEFFQNTYMNKTEKVVKEAEKITQKAEKAAQEVKLSSEDLITFSSKNKVSKEMKFFQNTYMNKTEKVADSVAEAVEKGKPTAEQVKKVETSIKEKVKKSPIKERAMCKIKNFFGKIKNLFKRNKNKASMGSEITEIKTAEDLAACLNNSNKVSKQTYGKFMNEFNKNVGSKTVKETVRTASKTSSSVNMNFPKNTVEKAFEQDTRNPIKDMISKMRK